jgi:hypothetical protein
VWETTRRVRYTGIRDRMRDGQEGLVNGRSRWIEKRWIHQVCNVPDPEGPITAAFKENEAKPPSWVSVTVPIDVCRFPQLPENQSNTTFRLSLSLSV